MINKEFPWFEKWFSQVSMGLERRPSALLLLGPKGMAKTEFGLELAASWLCQSPTQEGHGCGQCQSCGWMASRQHPDFRWVRPDADQEEGELTTDIEATPLSGNAKAEGEGSEKKSTEIKIEQIRSLAGFANVGSHRGGLRVVLISPANRMNYAAANALLKTLEEPAASLAFILVADTLRGLPATVISRCRKLSLQIEPDLLAQRQTDQSTAAEWLLPLLAQEGVDPIRWAEIAGKAPPAETLELLMRWMADISRVQNGLNPRAFPQHVHAMREHALKIRSPQSWAQALSEIQKLRAVAEHPLNPKLFYESIFDRFRRAFV